MERHPEDESFPTHDVVFLRLLVKLSEAAQAAGVATPLEIPQQSRLGQGVAGIVRFTLPDDEPHDETLWVKRGIICDPRIQFRGGRNLLTRRALQTLGAWQRWAAESESRDAAAGDGTKPEGNGPELKPLERALALLVTHPEWKDTQIAKAVGVARQTLYTKAWKPYQDARAIMKAARADLPRGERDSEGRIEAWQ